MTDYAQLAREHLRLHRPAQYADLMTDPAAAQRYFDQLGQQATALLEQIQTQTLASLPLANPQDPQANSVRETQARAIAEEIVLTELILVGDEETESMTDADGAYLGWEPGTQPLLTDATRLLH